MKKSLYFFYIQKSGAISMHHEKIKEIRQQIEYEYKRNSYPDGFSQMPDLSGRRYTDIEK